jgi:hypothetical protein
MVKKLFILGLFSALLSMATPAQAQLVAGQSAVMHYTKSNAASSNESEALFIKKKAIRAYLLKRNAPLADHVDTFIKACTTYDLDCYLLPAITGVESSFGVYMAQGTNNPFGWGRGLMQFTDFDEAIMTVARGLRENYIDKGAETVEQIGAIYCEGNTWSGKVNYFMQQIEKGENNQLFLGSDTVQL